MVIAYLITGFFLNAPIIFCYAWISEWFDSASWRTMTAREAAQNVLEDGILFEDGTGIIILFVLCVILCWVWPLTLAGLAVYAGFLWSIVKIKAWVKKQ